MLTLSLYTYKDMWQKDIVACAHSITERKKNYDTKRNYITIYLRSWIYMYVCMKWHFFPRWHKYIFLFSSTRQSQNVFFSTCICVKITSTLYIGYTDTYTLTIEGVCKVYNPIGNRTQQIVKTEKPHTHITEETMKQNSKNEI